LAGQRRQDDEVDRVAEPVQLAVEANSPQELD